MSYHMGKKRMLSFTNFPLGKKEVSVLAFHWPMIHSLLGHLVTNGESMEGAVKIFVTCIYKVNKKQIKPPPHFVLCSALGPPPGILKWGCLPHSNIPA